MHGLCTLKSSKYRVLVFYDQTEMGVAFAGRVVLRQGAAESVILSLIAHVISVVTVVVITNAKAVTIINLEVIFLDFIPINTRNQP